MTFRVLLLIPEELEFEMLDPELQDAINGIIGQWVMPMPGSFAAEGFKICDAVTADNFLPETLPEYAINWPIIGLRHFDNGEPFTEVQELNWPEINKRLPEESQNVLPHHWAGWPD